MNTAEERAETSEELVEREQRIQERRERIRQREYAKQHPEQIEQIEEPNPFPENEQIPTSLNQLKLLRSAGTELVSNVYVAAQAREFDRRKESEEKKKVRIDKLQEEADQSLEKFEAIRRRWISSQSREIPQDLRDALNDQVKACDNLLSGKNVLLDELNRELKGSEDEYVKTLKKQYDDLEIISQRMEEQYKTMDHSYRDEITQIITALDHQFDSRIFDWQKQATELRSKEESFLGNRMKLRDEQQALIDELRMRDAEDVHATKIKLETDVQVLEQQLESMRASYQLNQEKLEYNFKILKKRDDENTITNSQQKRRLTRLQDTLNNLRSKTLKQEKMYEEEAISLKEDYRRLLQQYADFQKKKSHFEEADNRKFREVWKMNQEEVEELVTRIEAADQIITEQQLGQKYENSRPKKAEETAEESRSAMDYARSVLSDTQVNDTTADKVFKVLCQECKFLVEEKLSVLLKPLEENERRLIMIDAILAAINIDTEIELQQLIQAVKDIGVIREWPNKNDPNLVYKGIIQYLQSRAGREKRNSSVVDLSDGTRKSWSYWDEMANVIPEIKLRLWDALYEAMKKYYSTLQGRAKLITDNDKLKTQNEELRILLHQYVTSEVNKELQIPPSKVLNIDS